ncbi:hypothetical protein L3Y34_000521 [Caenorhabditis briggsae]|uniref:Gamma-glutamylcyclotransferase family protein n=1 Tax=Caenorhabditis briggsae TaxID=6238 RepID=A0AAE9D9S5_CAEBR|nr:hypothetical protein L3Y34_000521 [Caenorhabditis briggsae]
MRTSIQFFQNIEGELYEVDAKKLEILDELEAYPTLYDRKEIEIKLSTDGSIRHAYIYLLRSWRADLLATSSVMLTTYSSLGPHGRVYVDTENVTSEEDMYQ